MIFCKFRINGDSGAWLKSAIVSRLPFGEIVEKRHHLAKVESPQCLQEGDDTEVGAALEMNFAKKAVCFFSVTFAGIIGLAPCLRTAAR